MSQYKSGIEVRDAYRAQLEGEGNWTQGCEAYGSCRKPCRGGDLCLWGGGPNPGTGPFGNLSDPCNGITSVCEQAHPYDEHVSKQLAFEAVDEGPSNADALVSAIFFGVSLGLTPLKAMALQLTTASNHDQTSLPIVAGFGLNTLLPKPIQEGIYQFRDLRVSPAKPYVGQSGNIPSRLGTHIQNGRLRSAADAKVTEVLGGKTVREIAEHRRIQQMTGGVPARFSDKVTNKKDPIGPNRRHLLGE